MWPRTHNMTLLYWWAFGTPRDWPWQLTFGGWREPAFTYVHPGYEGPTYSIRDLMFGGRPDEADADRRA